MSAVVSEMLIRIAADTAQLRSQMQQAERTVGGSLDSIKNVATQARNALIGFFAIDKAMDLATTFIKTADAMAQVQARLKLVTNGQKELESVQRDVYRISQQNNIGLEEMSQLYAKLHDPVKRLGGTTAETTKITEAFALSLRVGGASTQEAASATLQFAQAMASGRLNGDEFRSIAEASPRFMKALADGMNVPIEQLKKMSGEGQLTADVVGNALMKSLGQLQQESQGIPDTVGGAFTRLKNDVAVLTTEFNNATGATGGLAEVVGGLADWVKQITSAFKAWGEATSGTKDQIDLVAVAIKIVGTVLETLLVIGSEVVYIFKAIGKTFSDMSTLAKAYEEGGLKGVAEAYKTLRAENEANREAHNKFTASVVGATDRVLQARDALKNNSLSAAENSNEMARLAARHGQAEGAVLKSKVANEDATKAEAKRVAEVKKLMDGLEDQVGAMLAAENATGKLTKAEQTALKVMQDLQQGRIKLTDAEKVALRQSLENLIATEKRIDAARELAEAQRKAAEHSSKLTEAEWKEVDALREGNVKLMQQNDGLRLGQEAIVKREAAVLRSRASDLEWQAAMEGGNAALDEQARLLRQRADLIEEGNALEYARATADEWKRTAENIEQSLTDSLMRAFESGKDFGKALKDTLKNLFNTLVLRPIIQPVAQGLAGGVLGMLGMPASASTIGGPGAMNSLTNLLSGGMNFLTGKTISAGVSGAWTRAGDWLATSSNNGLAGIGDFMQANPGIGNFLGMAGNAFAGYQLGSFANSTISGKYSVGNGFNNVANIGAAVASAFFGPIGGAIVGGITGLINRAFGRGPREVQESGIIGVLSGDSASGQNFSRWHQDGGWFRSDRSGVDYTAMSSEMVNALAAGAAAVKGQVDSWAMALKMPAQALNSIAHNFRITFGKDEAENQKAIENLMNDYQNAMVSRFEGFLKPFQRAGETLANTMQRLAIIQTFSDSIEHLGGVFLRVARSGFDARQSLIDLAGGLDNLVSGINQFVSDYYTESEKAGMSAKAIAEALKAVGIDAGGLMTREDFRRLVESRDVNTELGRQQLVTLLQLGPQFAQLSDYLKEMGITVESAVKDAPAADYLNKMVDPAQTTATAVTTMANSVDQSNTLLTKIESKLSSIFDVSKGAADAAQAAAQAAQAAVKAAQDAVRAASLASSAPTYTSNLGA